MQDKTTLSALFRNRLLEAMDLARLSKAALARQVGVDRAAITLMTRPDDARLPRAETVCALARALQVSSDWLLGLSNARQQSGQILDGAVEIADENPLDPDEQLLAWHREAVGQRVRYLPANLPDMMLIDPVVDYLQRHRPDGDAPRERGLTRRRRANVLDNSELMDMEICLPVGRLQSLARGDGPWRALDRVWRRAQLEQIEHLHQTLYPRLRLYLIGDYPMGGAPYTIFGHHRAAIYLGDAYFVFSTRSELIQMHRHFDQMIRRARWQPTDVPALIGELLRDV